MHAVLSILDLTVVAPTFTLKHVQVGMVYDQSNIWANMQVDAQPWSMKWSLSNKRLWKPFFGVQVRGAVVPHLLVLSLHLLA